MRRRLRLLPLTPRTLPPPQVKGQRRELLISAEKRIDGLDKHESAVQAALERAAAAPPVPVVRPWRMPRGARHAHASHAAARACAGAPGRLRGRQMQHRRSLSLRCACAAAHRRFARRFTLAARTSLTAAAQVLKGATARAAAAAMEVDDSQALPSGACLFLAARHAMRHRAAA